MKRRVVITGVGAVTPLGVGARTLHERWASGVCGIADGAGRCDEFEPGEHLSVKEARRLDRFAQLDAGIRRGGTDRRRLGRRAAVRPAADRLRVRHRDRRTVDDRGAARRDARAGAADGLAARDPDVHAERGRGGGVDEVRPARSDVRRRVGVLERRPRDRLRDADDPVRRRGRRCRRRLGGRVDAVCGRVLRVDAGALADRCLAPVRRPARRVRDGRGGGRAGARGGRRREGARRDRAGGGRRLRIDFGCLPPDRARAERRPRVGGDRAGARRCRDHARRRRVRECPRDIYAA